MKKIIITKSQLNNKECILSCLISDNEMVDMRVLPVDDTSILGKIYVGRVQKIVGNIQAAFVEIAPGVSCYYPMKQSVEPMYVKRHSPNKLSQNDEILVQVTRESVKTKAPTVSTNLNITGRFCVLTTENKNIGISGKFNKEERIEFKEWIEENYSGPYGIVMRTNARNVSKDELLIEIAQLSEQLEHIIAFSKSRTCYSCVYQGIPKYIQYLQNSYSEDLDEIITDQMSIYESINAYKNTYTDLKNIPLRLYEDSSYPLSNVYNLNKQLERAINKTVWLKSGGFLVIEPTEALTVIDVNTGKSTSKADKEKHFYQINLEAAEEICRQLRLRNISGIVIIDFIDMQVKEHQDHLLECLKTLAKRDPIPVQIHGMTSLNLVEITRKKVEKTLLEQIQNL